jgi:DNA-binding response OmpR family regulator
MINVVKNAGQFGRRILLVDSNEALLQGCSGTLQAEGFDVITARNGFEALNVLRGARPDVLVTELNLPHMSGFELLSVVRKRFPLISVIATSDAYTAITLPRAAICDVFVPKSAEVFTDLIAEARTLIRESPIRGSQPKAAVAPVWIPRSATDKSNGYEEVASAFIAGRGSGKGVGVGASLWGPDYANIY